MYIINSLLRRGLHEVSSAGKVICIYLRRLYGGERVLLIGNRMVSRAIWTNKTREFSKSIFSTFRVSISIK